MHPGGFSSERSGDEELSDGGGSPMVRMNGDDSTAVGFTGESAGRFSRATTGMRGGSGRGSSSSLLGAGGRSSLRRTRSIVVLGQSMVGKTALCVRCVNERFEESYEPTYETSFVKVLVHRGQEVECLIKDTAGVGDQEIFRNEYGLGVHGYLLVYSVASQRSFDIVQAINEKLLSLMGTRMVPRVLVGNKVDLAQGGARQVSTEAGQALADAWGCAFIEVSAKADVNCNQAFHALLDEIDEFNEPDGARHHESVMQCCWRSISRCCWCCTRSSSASSSSSRRSNGVTSGGEQQPLRGGRGRSRSNLEEMSSLTFRKSLLAKTAAWVLLALGAGGLIFATLLGTVLHIPGATPDEEELLTYLLFATAILVWMLAAVGISALRSLSADLLQVYAAALTVLIAVQCVTAAVLFVHMSVLQPYLLPLLLVAVPVWLVQIAAAWTGGRLARNLHDPITAGLRSVEEYDEDGASPDPAFRTTYNSLYE